MWIVVLAIVRQGTNLNFCWLPGDVAVPPANWLWELLRINGQPNNSLKPTFLGCTLCSASDIAMFTQPNPHHCESALNNDCLFNHNALLLIGNKGVLNSGSANAAKCNVGAAWARPYLIPVLNRVPHVMECPLIGFAHGDSPTKDKVFATKRAAGTGCKEVCLVVNVFKVQRSDWPHVKEEIQQVNTVVTETGGILKVMADWDYLKDRQRVELEDVCTDLGIPLANMADRHGFVKLPNGFYAYEA